MTEPAYPLTSLEDDGHDWPVQGEWTYRDFLRLPEDGQRHEVLQGVLYVTPAPAYAHQFAIWRLGYYLSHRILEGNLGVLLTSPFDVRLPNRLADPVEPDLVFFRAGNEPRTEDKNFVGVPDLVIEVLSPGTRRVDEKVKLSIYREAGIPEYWLVDPKVRRVLIFRLSEDRGRYVEWARGRDGDVVSSTVLSGLRLEVSNIFPAVPAPRA
jgi:Uma2 family endonuclease